MRRQIILIAAIAGFGAVACEKSGELKLGSDPLAQEAAATDPLPEAAAPPPPPPPAPPPPPPPPPPPVEEEPAPAAPTAGSPSTTL